MAAGCWQKIISTNVVSGSDDESVNHQCRWCLHGAMAACASVIGIGAEIVDEISRARPQVDGYVLAAEIAGVARANELVDKDEAPRELTVEVDNSDVPRVIEEGYQPKQFARIPDAILEDAVGFWRMHNVRFRVLPRNSTAGLRRSHRLASQRLWAKR